MCGGVVPQQADVLAGVGVLGLVPLGDAADLAAAATEMLVLGIEAAVDAEFPALRVVADVACLKQQEVLAVVRVGAVAVDRDDAADAPVVEGERAEMLGDENDREALAFIRAERARWHDLALGEAERQTPVVQLWDETVVTEHATVQAEAIEGAGDACAM